MTSRGAISCVRARPAARAKRTPWGRSLSGFYEQLPAITDPGTVDGGDVCEADGHFLIGVSARTNEDGARQLAEHLHRFGYSSSIIDIRGNAALLHLKSGIAYLGDGVWVAQDGIERELRSQTGIHVRDLITVMPQEAYAANCVRVNDAVLVAAGYPTSSAAIAARGCRVIELEMSEFRKMDGGLSCLSLRF